MLFMLIITQKQKTPDGQGADPQLYSAYPCCTPRSGCIWEGTRLFKYTAKNGLKHQNLPRGKTHLSLGLFNGNSRNTLGWQGVISMKMGG